jgi:hypothetical protein
VNRLPRVPDTLGQLKKLAADYRRQNPKLSPEEAFAAAYTDNPELAAAERIQNRPHTPLYG